MKTGSTKEGSSKRVLRIASLKILTLTISPHLLMTSKKNKVISPQMLMTSKKNKTMRKAILTTTKSDAMYHSTSRDRLHETT